LKIHWGFDGVVFSDDLSMKGAFFFQKVAERVQVSLESGCDMALICNHPEFVDEVIDLDWPGTEKIQSMRGIKLMNLEKTAIDHHLDQIKTLL
jgi:beta-N-acetylhexosaminidase